MEEERALAIYRGNGRAICGQGTATGVSSSVEAFKHVQKEAQREYKGIAMNVRALQSSLDREDVSLLQQLPHKYNSQAGSSLVEFNCVVPQVNTSQSTTGARTRWLFYARIDDTASNGKYLSA